MTEPRIYAACLASYNAGILHGKWIDASTDVDAMQAEIAAMLRASPCPNVRVPKDADSAGRVAELDIAIRALPGPFPNDEHESLLAEHMALTVLSAEEWAIHDYEGLGSDLGEYAGLEAVARRVEIIEAADDAGLPAAVLLEAMADEPDDADPADFVSERYRGTADSWADFAQELTEECHDMSEVPEWCRYHIDWESIGRDFELSGDFFAIRHDGEFHFFWAH